MIVIRKGATCFRRSIFMPLSKPRLRIALQNRLKDKPAWLRMAG